MRTGLLLAALTGLLAVVGHLVGGTVGLLIALLFAVAMNGATYWFSDRLALAMAHARPVARSDAPLLYAQVEDLAARAGVPRPAVYLSDDPSPNAFATGRTPRHAAVAVTTGLLQLLDPHELRGVLAHEFAHIRNRDILLTTVAAGAGGPERGGRRGAATRLRRRPPRLPAHAHLYMEERAEVMHGCTGSAGVYAWLMFDTVHNEMP